MIRQGLPMIAAAGADAGYAEVREQNICPFHLGQLINYQGIWEKAGFLFHFFNERIGRQVHTLQSYEIL